MSAPFLTFYTPTHKRPTLLARCLQSVWAQTAVDDLEQLVVPDHVGVGVGGMYDRIPLYAAAVHGRYVHVLADDDELAAPDVVERLRADVAAAGDPPLVVARAYKGMREFPRSRYWPPVLRQLDLGCLVVRRDVWLANLDGYGGEYWGDYLFAARLAEQGVVPAWSDVRLVVGAVLYGKPERADVVDAYVGLEAWRRAPRAPREADRQALIADLTPESRRALERLYEASTDVIDDGEKD